jgi:hypothetical protein
MVGWVMENLKGFATMRSSGLIDVPSRNFSGVTYKGNEKNLRHVGRDSNQATSEYKSKDRYRYMNLPG